MTCFFFKPFKKVNQSGYNFNCLLLNRYNNGACIAPHADDEVVLDAEHPIMGIRLGTDRPLTFSKIIFKVSTNFNIKHGSAYIMCPFVQVESKHSVPKSSDMETLYTLTFRRYGRNLNTELSSETTKTKFQDEIREAVALNELSKFGALISEIIQTVDQLGEENPLKNMINERVNKLVSQVMAKLNSIEKNC